MGQAWPYISSGAATGVLGRHDIDPSAGRRQRLGGATCQDAGPRSASLPVRHHTRSATTTRPRPSMLDRAGLLETGRRPVIAVSSTFHAPIMEELAERRAPKGVEVVLTRARSASGSAPPTRHDSDAVRRHSASVQLCKPIYALSDTDSLHLGDSAPAVSASDELLPGGGERAVAPSRPAPEREPLWIG